MKYLILSLLLVSCGKDEEIKEDKDMEVTSVAADPDYSSARIEYASTNGDLFISRDWTVVFALSEGWTAPKCDTKDPMVKKAVSKVTPVFSNLEPETVYSVRACAHKADNNFYSHGATVTFTTEELPDYLKPSPEEVEEEQPKPEYDENGLLKQ